MKQLFAGLWNQKVGREARPQRLLWGSPGRGLGPWVLLGGKVVVARTSHPRTETFCSPLPGRQLAVEVKCSPSMSVSYLGISVVCVCLGASLCMRTHPCVPACARVCVSEPVCVEVGLPASLGVCVCTCVCLGPCCILRGLCVFQLGTCACMHVCVCANLCVSLRVPCLWVCAYVCESLIPFVHFRWGESVPLSLGTCVFVCV